MPILVSGKLPASVNLYILYFLNLGGNRINILAVFPIKVVLLQAYQRGDLVSKSFIITDTVKYILQIISLVFFKNYYYYCITLLACQIFNNILTAYRATKEYPLIRPVGELEKQEKKQINRKIKDLFTTKVAHDITLFWRYSGHFFSVGIGRFGYISKLLLSHFFCTRMLYHYHTAITAGIGNSLIVDTHQKVKETFDALLFSIIWMVSFCVDVLYA